ncbi:hypothetical protein [Pseudoalteromonas rubra]|uniref:Uncharacterized protein n=1 Tax=Pseudoalteromonas rubra TaxID=43658 RepID=A0A0F4QVG4_9GAMM|nr:hypothetical protein [Pseudoalteromonas rubra]KJZ11668.1 hypothetical protein TW77_05405 [Pseudoalteromonas rubra]
MSVSFTEIEASLEAVDAACQAGELEEAQRLFKHFDEQLRATLTQEMLAESQATQQAAISLFNHIQTLSGALQQSKVSVAKELSQFVGNQKKIKAYKNT